MPVDPEQTAVLRALHEKYVWEVNAAVAEGRSDLVEFYCDEYLELAVQAMAEGVPVAGVRPPPPRSPGRWRRLLGRRRTR